jgi:hypothetical protein
VPRDLRAGFRASMAASVELRDRRPRRGDQCSLSFAGTRLGFTGPVTLNPEKPDVGRPYFRVSCKFDSLTSCLAAPPASQGWRPTWTPSSQLDSVHFGTKLLQ